MNLLEYFKMYPIFRDQVGLSGTHEASSRMLSEMEALLAAYVPSDVDRRTEYRLTDEKEFIRLHCIEGKSVEQTAENMCISRDTAYRIRRRLCNKEVPQSPIASIGEQRGTA